MSTVTTRIIENIPLPFNGFGWREKENRRQANEKRGVKRNASFILWGELCAIVRLRSQLSAQRPPLSGRGMETQREQDPDKSTYDTIELVSIR